MCVSSFQGSGEKSSHYHAKRHLNIKRCNLVCNKSEASSRQKPVAWLQTLWSLSAWSCFLFRRKFPLTQNVNYVVISRAQKNDKDLLGICTNMCGCPENKANRKSWIRSWTALFQSKCVIEGRRKTIKLSLLDWYKKTHFLSRTHFKKLIRTYGSAREVFLCTGIIMTDRAINWKRKGQIELCGITAEPSDEGIKAGELGRITQFVSHWSVVNINSTLLKVINYAILLTIWDKLLLSALKSSIVWT